MNKLKLLILCFIILCNQSAFAQIIKTFSSNSETMRAISKWVDGNTLILIELDNSLVVPKSAMFNMKANNPYRSFIQNMLTLSKDQPRYQEIISTWYQQREVMLVEDGWKDFINAAKTKGATVYGICTMPISVKNIERKRYEELKALDIKLSPELNGQDMMEISPNKDWPTNFYQGILFTGYLSKANALMQLIKTTHKFPGKLLVIASSEKELGLVEKALWPLKTLDSKIVNYIGMMNMPLVTLDKDLILFQQQLLIKQGRWLEDKEAKEAMANPK